LWSGDVTIRLLPWQAQKDHKRDDPRAEVHILDAGHFAMDLKPKEVIGLVQEFMQKQAVP
jgi:pimeloyl-ACP methyl ester carboxylesterase